MDMKLGPVSKICKRNTAKSKTINNDVILTNCYLVVIFQFKANLEQYESRILDTWSVILLFSLTVIFYLTKTENRTKTSLIQLSCYIFE